MLAAERKLKIIEYVKEHRIASVAQLAEIFQVHEATIRRDLSEIEKHGELKRTHGGVVLNEGIYSEPPFSTRATEQVEEKDRIGKGTADLVEKGESIILDSGTTTLHIAKYLLDKQDITVVTNDINIAHELRDAPGVKLLVTGGLLYPENYMLNGIYTNELLDSLHVQKAFIGTPAIHRKYGLTHFDEQIVPAKKYMIKAAQEVIVVADHTKIDKVSLHTVSPIQDIHKLITGSEITEKQHQQFVDAGVVVMKV